MASQQRRRHSPQPPSDHSRPGTKRPSQLAAPRLRSAASGPTWGVGGEGVTGPAWRLPVCWASPAECPWPQGPPPWGLSAEWGWGTGSPQPRQGLAEMSATKDWIQRGLSRNKGQVLVWDEGWGWAGQMFTWNGLSGHPQATGAAGAWHRAFLPTTMGHCKGSDSSQMGTNPKELRGDCQPRPWHGHSLPGPARC